MADGQAPDEPRKRRSKRFLTPSQKYEIWLQLVRQEVTIGEAAEQQRVDRSTVVRIRQVAKDGALAAKAEVARLCEAIKEMAVRLTLAEGKDGWG